MEKDNSKKNEIIKWMINEISHLIRDGSSLDLLHEMKKSYIEIHKYIGYPSPNDMVISPTGSNPRLEDGKHIRNKLKQMLLRPGMYTGRLSKSKKSRIFIYAIRSTMNELKNDGLYKWTNPYIHTIVLATSKDLAMSLINMAFQIRYDLLDVDDMLFFI